MCHADHARCLTGWRIRFLGGGAIPTFSRLGLHEVVGDDTLLLPDISDGRFQASRSFWSCFRRACQLLVDSTCQAVKSLICDSATMGQVSGVPRSEMTRETRNDVQRTGSSEQTSLMRNGKLLPRVAAKKSRSAKEKYRTLSASCAFLFGCWTVGLSSHPTKQLNRQRRLSCAARMNSGGESPGERII